MDISTHWSVGIWLVGALEAAALVYLALQTLPLVFRQKSQIEQLRHELEQAKDENTVIEMIARHASDGLLVQDIHSHIEWSNLAYSRITGFSAEELRGHKPQEFLLPAENAMSAEEIAAFKYDLSSGFPDSVEVIRNVRKNGEYFWNQLSFATVNYNDAKDPKIIVISRDITAQIEREEDLKRAKEETQFRAEHDTLTGLPNRLMLSSFLSDTLQKAGHGNEVGILHIDLDQFKAVNDTLGHAAGDAVLVHAAEIMCNQVRENDLVCRFGGDEFIIVCPGIDSFPVLERMAKRIIANLKRPMIWEGQKIGFGSSIGIAMSGDHTRDQEELIRQADTALYEVKNNGRNGFLSYTEEVGALVSHRTELSASLRHAISNNQLGIVLQPQFDIRTKTVKGFEALVRWYHPRRGVLVPADFFDVAEINGCMEDIDTIAISGALDALRFIRNQGYPLLRMSINVSAQMLNRPGYVDKLKWEVDKHNLDPKDVCVEVLETILIQDGENTASRAISALSNAGFAVELDDFGTGYSGLANLARLKIDGVKIDRALIQDVPKDQTAQTILKAILHLCKDLGLSVLCEGVEHYEQAKFFQEIGGEHIQGYGVARPMSLECAMRWLQETDMNNILAEPDDVHHIRHAQITA